MPNRLASPRLAARIFAAVTLCLLAMWLGMLSFAAPSSSSSSGAVFQAGPTVIAQEFSGDVLPNHFVQAVNTSVGIYDKSSGTALATFTFESLWGNANTGTSCDSFHGGDPTVIYVPQFDRFIVADFSWFSIQNGPYYECVA